MFRLYTSSCPSHEFYCSSTDLHRKFRLRIADNLSHACHDQPIYQYSTFRLVRFNDQNLASYCLWIDLHTRNRTYWIGHRDRVFYLQDLARLRTRFDYRKLLLVVFQSQYRLLLAKWYIWGLRASFWFRCLDCNFACTSWHLTSTSQLAVSLLWRKVLACLGSSLHISASFSIDIAGDRTLRS